MMVPLIQSILHDSATVRAQLDDPVRTFPGTVLADTAMPYFTRGATHGSPLKQLSDPPPTNGWRLRLTVWDATLSDANATAVVIREEIERRGSIEPYNPAPDDVDTGAFGISFDVRLLQLR
ncbi:tail completion protein gp17 [Stenotrophomonas acidaminiphila]